LEWDLVISFLTAWYNFVTISFILWQYGVCTYVVTICYFYPHFGILPQEKSGNPGDAQEEPHAKPAERGSGFI
jgi:hypothetical protein